MWQRFLKVRVHPPEIPVDDPVVLDERGEVLGGPETSVAEYALPEPGIEHPPGAVLSRPHADAFLQYTPPRGLRPCGGSRLPRVGLVRTHNRVGPGAERRLEETNE